MFGFTLADILNIISLYGYFVVFPVSVLEGPMVAVISGSLVAIGRFNWFIAYAILVLGDILGDIGYYAIGRWGRLGFIKRWGKYVGVTEERVRALEIFYFNHDWKIILINKTQPIGSAGLVAAGLTAMPFARFLFYSTVGTLPKVALLELVGFYFGDGLAKVNNYLTLFGIISFVISTILMVGYWLIKRHFQKKIPL